VVSPGKSCQKIPWKEKRVKVFQQGSLLREERTCSQEEVFGGGGGWVLGGVWGGGGGGGGGWGGFWWGFFWVFFGFWGGGGKGFWGDFVVAIPLSSLEKDLGEGERALLDSRGGHDFLLKKDAHEGGNSGEPFGGKEFPYRSIWRSVVREKKVAQSSMGKRCYGRWGD